MDCDIRIRNGWIVDGSGRAAFRGELAIRGGVINALTAGELPDDVRARHTIDADGHVVAPGFIDVHVHSERALVEGGEDRWAGIRQGVTTQLSGPDGFSWTHVRHRLRDEMRQYLQVFYGDTPASWGGDTVDAYRNGFAGRLPGHLALQAPHGAIRAAVMGWSTSSADRRQLERMKGLLREWMEAGAVSFCSGLEYEPTVHADFRELAELCETAAAYGGVYVAHQRGSRTVTPSGTAETTELALATGIPVHISHFTLDAERTAYLERMEKAGVDYSFDMYPYPAGCTHLLYYLPPWAQAGSPEEVKRRLRDPEARRRIAAYTESRFPPERLRLASIRAATYADAVGRTMAELVRDYGMPLTELICELLLASDLQALFIYHWAPEREPLLEATFRHPRHMVSTDGIFVPGRPHPRGFGTYPRVLGEWVRERRRLTLEQAVYKMSGFPARRFGLRDRGLLEVGKAADLVVFDPAVVGSEASFERPRTAPSGIRDVLVEGQFVVRDGEVTGALPGRVLRDSSG